jgi:AmmeMemoRadiSam system protein A
MKELLKIARDTLESQFNGKIVKIDEILKKKYSKPGACFVTLTLKGELRGCIGSLQAHQELWKDVVDNSINAGFNDPRFNPITLDELKDIKIDISVLTTPQKLGIGKYVFEKIDNKMGIVLKKGWNSATFLPQVWKELSDKKEFLEHLSRKAGLFKDDWKESEISYYRVESIEE